MRMRHDCASAVLVYSLPIRASWCAWTDEGRLTQLVLQDTVFICELRCAWCSA